MSLPYAKVVVNPVAGGGSVARDWPQICRLLRDAGLSFEHELTRGIGDATEIARRAADTGYGCLIAVGGDGTVNEIANGILNSAHSGNVILGIVSAGTACSFARSLSIPQDYINACSLLTDQRKALIDVGVVQCRNQEQLLKRFFVNTADVGFGSEIVHAWKHLPSRFGHSINYSFRTVEGLRSLLSHRNKSIKISVGDEVKVIDSCIVVVANGQYFAGGMQIAPNAKLDDGLLDVVIVGDVGRSELLKLWPTLYSGSHMRHPKISERKATIVTIESDERLFVEADGVIVGEIPASFWVIPSALTIIA